MNDKYLLKALGLNNKTISIGLDDEYAQIIIEKKIDDYLKKIDEDKKKENMVDLLQKGHLDFKEKEHLVEMIESKYVSDKIREKLIVMGFSYRCPTCLDVSSQYGRSIQNYPKYNR